MIPERAKVDVITRYLERQFPGSVVEDQYDFDRGAQTFKVSRDHGHYLAKLDEEFLDDQSVDTLGQWLEDTSLDVKLRAAPSEIVWVMLGGELVVRPRG